jgi:hypothetical protein
MQKYLSHTKDTDEKPLDIEIDFLWSTTKSRMNKSKDIKITETVRVEENQDLIYFKVELRTVVIHNVLLLSFTTHCQLQHI